MASTEIVWTEGADRDFDEAFSLLLDHSENVAIRFFQTVESCLHLLLVFPEMAPTFHRKIRRFLLKGTNFGLFYRIEDRGIVVIAIIHLQRNVEAIRGVLDQRL